MINEVPAISGADNKQHFMIIFSLCYYGKSIVTGGLIL